MACPTAAATKQEQCLSVDFILVVGKQIMIVLIGKGHKAKLNNDAYFSALNPYAQ
jgi:hypothetical protein